MHHPEDIAERSSTPTLAGGSDHDFDSLSLTESTAHYHDNLRSPTPLLAGDSPEDFAESAAYYRDLHSPTPLLTSDSPEDFAESAVYYHPNIWSPTPLLAGDSQEDFAESTPHYHKSPQPAKMLPRGRYQDTGRPRGTVLRGRCQGRGKALRGRTTTAVLRQVAAKPFTSSKRKRIFPSDSEDEGDVHKTKLLPEHSYYKRQKFCLSDSEDELAADEGQPFREHNHPSFGAQIDRKINEMRGMSSAELNIKMMDAELTVAAVKIVREERMGRGML